MKHYDDQTELLVVAERLSKNLLEAHKEFETELANYKRYTFKGKIQDRAASITYLDQQKKLAQTKLKLEDLVDAWAAKEEG